MQFIVGTALWISYRNDFSTEFSLLSNPSTQSRGIATAIV